MKIIVAIKQVPVRDSQLRVDGSGKWIQEADLSFEINEPDAYALEEALQLKEKHGGEVIALCAGPARAAQTIREALAKGADRAIHIEEENLNTLDTLGVARLLAGAAKTENPDLFFTGLQSDDLGYGQTGVVVAGDCPKTGAAGLLLPVDGVVAPQVGQPGVGDARHEGPGVGQIDRGDIGTPLAANAFMLGSGPVRGFAVILCLGIVTSMFTAVWLTRLIVAFWYRRTRPKLVPL